MSVHNQEELFYIRENLDYINCVIKKSNFKNKIIFLVPRFLYQDKLPCDYILEIDEFRLGNLGILRSIFDSNRKLQNFCIENYNPDKRKNNLIFDSNSHTTKLRKSTDI